MKNIKFRAYDSLAKKMYNWTELLNQNLKNIFTIPEQCGYNLMQYTGLKDRNMKEIYEGDIIKVNEDIRKAFDLKKIMYVVFMEGAFYLKAEKEIKWELLRCFPAIVGIEGNARVEVIGNIYDNPELLEERG